MRSVTRSSPMQKSTQRMLFGKEADGKHCLGCSKVVNPKTEFKDALSRKEWGISYFCQKCQDEAFDEEGEVQEDLAEAKMEERP